MNIQIRYNANEFNEVHPRSQKPLPTIEEIPCQTRSGYESFDLTLVWQEGESKMGASPDQIARLKKYLCPPAAAGAGGGEPVNFKGHWHKEDARRNAASGQVEYESEVFLFEGPLAHLALRMQHPSDKLKVGFCPEDQTRSFVGKWTSDTELSFRTVKAPVSALDEEMAKLSALDTLDLQTLAPAIGVKWDEKASRDTMIARMAKKRAEKRTRAASDVDSEPKGQLETAKA